MSEKKRLTKAQVIAELADLTELDKKSVSRIFDGLNELIKRELKKKPREFVIPGLLKLKAVEKPAVKGGEKKPNPFKPGEFVVTKAKPKSVRIRASALKSLKDLVQ